MERSPALAPEDPLTPALSRRTGSGGHTPWPALYQWLVTAPDVGPAVAAVRDRAWAALRYDNTATLPLAVAGRLFPLPLHATVGQLETMAACPFRHFARYGLGLRGPEDARVTAVDLNRAYHDVLERLVHDLMADRPRLVRRLDAGRAPRPHPHARRSTWAAASSGELMR